MTLVSAAGQLCYTWKEKKKIKEVNPILGCRKPTLAFALNPDGLMYMLCVACAKMYMLMKNSLICLTLGDRLEWLMKPAFSELCPYENNYRARDDWLWWGRRGLTGANTLSLQTLTFIESQFVIVSVLSFSDCPLRVHFIKCSNKVPYASSPALMVSAIVVVKYIRMHRP